MAGSIPYGMEGDGPVHRGPSAYKIGIGAGGDGGDVEGGVDASPAGLRGGTGSGGARVGLVWRRPPPSDRPGRRYAFPSLQNRVWRRRGVQGAILPRGVAERLGGAAWGRGRRSGQEAGRRRVRVQSAARAGTHGTRSFLLYPILVYALTPPLPSLLLRSRATRTIGRHAFHACHFFLSPSRFCGERRRRRLAGTRAIACHFLPLPSGISGGGGHGGRPGAMR